MMILAKIKCNMNLKDYISSGISFHDYKEHIENTIKNGDSTDSLYEYYGLNKARMKRLEKKFELSDNAKKILGELKENIYLIAITEGWCGDAAQVLPIIEKITNESPLIETKIVLRDKNPELMDQYLTNGNKSIPIIIGVNEKGEELFHWGTRPKWAEPILANYKKGELTKDEFIKEIQSTYNKDKGKSIENELIDLISK